MVDKDDDTGTSTPESHESKTGDKHYEPSPHAWVSVEWRDGCLDFDAGVTPSEVERIAALAQVSKDQIKPLAACLRAILLSYAMSVSNRDKTTGRHFTRRQLLDAISKLTQQRECNEPPAVPSWLVGELVGIEAHRVIEAKLGRQTRLDLSNDELHHMLAVRAQAFEHAEKRVEDSLNDPGALLELATDAHRAVSARSDTTQEWLAMKRALQPGKSLIADSVLQFWTESLGRPPKVTDMLIAFADAVYRLCGVEMKVDAAKRQLHNSVRQRPSQT
jgi:hypothetical protein